MRSMLYQEHVRFLSDRRKDQLGDFATTVSVHDKWSAHLDGRAGHRMTDRHQSHTKDRGTQHQSPQFRGHAFGAQQIGKALFESWQ